MPQSIPLCPGLAARDDCAACFFLQQKSRYIALPLPKTQPPRFFYAAFPIILSIGMKFTSNVPIIPGPRANDYLLFYLCLGL
jgi:hypothetical protein